MCLICDRIEMIKQGTNPYFVKELETGYVVIGDNQHFYGYTLFLYKKHGNKTEIFHLEKDEQAKFLEEMTIVAEAVSKAFGAEKMNYELLGMGDAHLHWHLNPRRTGDIENYGNNGKGPVWWYPMEKMYSDDNRPSEEKQEKTKETIQGVATIAAATLAASGNRKKGFFSGLLVGLVAGIALTFMFNSWLATAFKNPVEEIKDDFDTMLTETFAGYTAADFADAVLGEATQHQELIVMEQPLEIATTITKSGLGGWAVFSKTKEVTYAGTGVYTVDLKDIDADHISVDEDSKTVTISINHSVLQYVNIDYDNMKFEDTEKGLLSFGDITLTMEQQNELEKSVQDSMREVLMKDTLLNQADEFAKMKTWEIFQPIVSSVSPEFMVEIVFNS